MDLKTRLSAELTQAMKQREAVKTATLRLLISAIRNKEIERKKDLADADVLEVIQSEAKRRKESIEQYKNANRAELVAKEDTELKILLAYLPEAMSESQLRELVQGVLKDVGARGPQDIGKVMSAVMPKIKGRGVDGKQAQQIVQQLLKS